MKRKSKIKIIRIVVTIIAITALIGLIAYLLPIIKDISTEEGQLAFRDKVNQLGIWGVLLLFALEVAQIFLIVLPGEPLEVLAGICYGSIGGSIFIFVSVLLTTMVIFFLVQKLGRKFVIHFFDANKIYKIENSKLFQNPKKVEWL